MGKLPVNIPESAQWALAGGLAVGVLAVGFGLGRVLTDPQIVVVDTTTECIASSQHASMRLEYEATADRLLYAWTTDPESTEFGSEEEVREELARLAGLAADAGATQKAYENTCQGNLP